MKQVPIRYLFIFFALISCSHKMVAQKNELGGSLGVLNYRGEIAPAFNILNSRPAANLFFRKNFNPYISLRLGATFGLFDIAESKTNQPVADFRKAGFSGFLTEAAVTFEYNFLRYIVNYKERGNINKFTPYITGGLAYYYPQLSGKLDTQKMETKGAIAIPIGLGIKYMLGQNWNIGAEIVARKTFTDSFDGLKDNVIKQKLVTDPVTNDFYYYSGVSISYTIYKIHCPTKR